MINREDNTSGRLKGEEPFPSPSVHHSLLFSFIVPSPFFVLRCFSHRSALFPCRKVVLPQFWLPRRGSTSSNTGGVGVRFVFVVISLLLFPLVTIGDFSVGYFPLWCQCIFAAAIYRCGARNFHRCNFPDHIPSSLRSSRSFLR